MDILGLSRKDLLPICTYEGGNMGRMLNLLESVVTRARHLQDVGRTHDALSLLRRHANQPELPAPVAAEAHHDPAATLPGIIQKPADFSPVNPRI